MFKKSVLGLTLAFSSIAGFAQERMSPELLWELGRVGGEVVSPDGNTVVYGVTNYDLDKNGGERNLYAVPVAGGEVHQLTEMRGSEYGVQFRPDGRKIGFLHGGQWYEMDPDGTDIIQVTDIDGGISNVKYAPNGKYLMYTQEVKLDRTTKDLYPNLPKANAKIIDDLMYRHWDSWSDANYSHVFYIKYNDGRVSGNPVDIMKGERFDCPQMPFGGAEDLNWTPDSKSIVYVAKKKTGKEYATSTNSDLYVYTLRTGNTTNMTEGMMGYDTHPEYASDGRQVAWLSMARDGYESDKNNIYVYDKIEGRKYNVTKDFSETVSTFSWGEHNEKIYFLAPIEATYQIFELDLSNGASNVSKKSIRQITSGDYNYRGVQQAGGNIIAGRQDMNHATEIYNIDIKSGAVMPLTHVNDAIYANVEMSKIEKRWIKTTDGKKMLTWVIYPPNFDPNKKYPTLLYCQGGPQSPVSQFYSFRWNFQLMAANGYIVVAPNRRGLPSFGEKWNEDISGDWGGQAMKDYLSAIDALAKEPYVDEDNLGAVGASYGGYSVYMLAGIHNNRFKSFISHCGLFNLDSWYGTTEELFFANWDIGGPYWGKNPPKSYKLFSPHKYADKWNTPILVIHGGKDFRVPENQGMEAFQLAQLKGIHSKFLYFPEEGHWVLSPQNGMIWHSEFFQWLDSTLK